MHSSDWLPTIAHLTGIKIPASASLDGMNMWDMLSKQRPSPRVEIVHNINPIYPYTSYLLGNWKYVNGTVNPQFDTWLGDIPTADNPNAHEYTRDLFGSPAWKSVSKYRTKMLTRTDTLKLRERTKVICRESYSLADACDPMKAPCLFDLYSDPCETRNLANKLPKVLEVVELYLERAKWKIVPPNNKPLDPCSNPALNNGLWTYWLDLLEEEKCTI